MERGGRRERGWRENELERKERGGRERVGGGERERERERE